MVLGSDSYIGCNLHAHVPVATVLVKETAGSAANIAAAGHRCWQHEVMRAACAEVCQSTAAPADFQQAP
jgi:hypothetical protein